MAELMLWGGDLLYPLTADPSCCCGDRCCDLGATLTATITNKTGTATLIPTTLTFTRGGGLVWTSNTYANPCAYLGYSATSGMTLQCQSEGPLVGRWTLIGANFPFLVFAVVVSDCTRKRVEFDVAYNDGAGCSGSFHIAIQG